eukprot:Lankesteria_metandrocarpae@DN4909_c0_g1_i1.p1
MGCSCSRNLGPTHSRGFGTNGDIREKFKIGRVLGIGAFGQVRECMDKSTRDLFAVKIMEKKGGYSDLYWSNESMFRREVAILSNLGEHPNIVKYYSFYEDHNFLYAVLENCQGGELFEQIVKKKHLNEADAAVLCSQMLMAMQHLHERKIAHRDVKAENFIFKTKEDISPLKLIDFGMSSQLDENVMLTEICGSPHYLSPELLRRQYDEKADMWSLGVVMHLMLCGYYPFDGPTTSAIVKEIWEKQLDWSAAGANTPSLGAQDFLLKLLERDPQKRMTAYEALDHYWMSRALYRRKSTNKSIVESVRSAHRKVTFYKQQQEQMDTFRNQMEI